MVVTEVEAGSPCAATTALAGASLGELMPVMVTSVPPLKSMPGLSPTTPSRTAAPTMTHRAAEY